MKLFLCSTLSNYVPFKISFSNYGEDAMLLGLFSRLEWLGFEDILQPKSYLDLGSFDPIKDSNTYALYLRGWTGTLVDANATMERNSKKHRPRDIFINCLVSDSSGSGTFFMFSKSASSNTGDKYFADAIASSQALESPEVIPITKKSLSQIIDIHKETFLTDPFVVDIDLEGSDLLVLQQWNSEWNIPFILIEDEVLGVFNNSQIRSLMSSLNYSPVASNFITTIYLKRDSGYFEKLSGL